MNTWLTNSFQIPPASLQAIPYLILIFLVPLYETVFVPLARRLTGIDSGISPLQRVGIGLFVATFSMVSAALVEQKRRNSTSSLSILWIAPQFVIFGVSELFTAVGLIEFFYKQSVEGMQSFLTAMTYCSYSFGFYLSSLLVSLVNKISGGWLSHNDLNNDRLDLFYWLLAGLSLVNFFNYLFWANRFSQQPLPLHFQSQTSKPSNSKLVVPWKLKHITTFSCALFLVATTKFSWKLLILAIESKINIYTNIYIYIFFFDIILTSNFFMGSQCEHNLICVFKCVSDKKSMVGIIFLFVLKKKFFWYGKFCVKIYFSSIYLIIYEMQ